MVTRRRMLQGAGALALLSPFGKGFGHDQDKGVARIAQQEHAKPTGDGYVPVTDPLVKQKLAQWADWKFGLILHWGLYSVLGIVESWTLCSEDWIKRPGGAGYVEWKRRYEQLRTQFNPVKFDPARWAEAAQAAGMRYLVFTTKHHDGFCMFDTPRSETAHLALPVHRCVLVKTGAHPSSLAGVGEDLVGGCLRCQWRHGSMPHQWWPLRKYDHRNAT